MIGTPIEDRNGELYLNAGLVAFGRIKTSSLLLVLRRVGLPQRVLDINGAIYSNRIFMVGTFRKSILLLEGIEAP